MVTVRRYNAVDRSQSHENSRCERAAPFVRLTDIPGKSKQMVHEKSDWINVDRDQGLTQTDWTNLRKTSLPHISTIANAPSSNQGSVNP